MTNAKVQWGVPREARRVIAVAFPVTIGVWLLLYRFWPSPLALPDTTVRLVQAVGWSCIAGLFCLGAGIEAVAHERLQTAAFDPLAGRDSPRLQINQRFLQNTLEQFALLVPGLLGAACYAGSPATWRIVPATALVWIATRYAFWIGYHRSPATRALGVPGLVIPQLLLLYVAARFGYQMAGLPGGITPVVSFLLVEAVLFATTRNRAREAPGRAAASEDR